MCAVLVYYTVLWLRCIVAHTMIEFGVLTHIYAHNRCKVFILCIDRWIEYRVHWRKSECVSNASVKLVTFDIWQGESNKNRKNRAKKIRTNCSTWQHCSKKKEKNTNFRLVMNEKKNSVKGFSFLIVRIPLLVFDCSHFGRRGWKSGKTQKAITSKLTQTSGISTIEKYIMEFQLHAKIFDIFTAQQWV